MDSTDKMEEWAMLTVGRKWVVRSRMRKEKDVRMTRVKRVWVSEICRESRTDMGHSDIRQMAQSAQLCLHYSHWSSKNSHETKVIPAVRRCAPPVRLYVCGLWTWLFPPHATSFGCYTVSIDLRFTRRAYHMPCVWAHGAQTNCLLFSRGQGLVGLHSTQ